MLGDVELVANYNIPVTNNVITIPEETGVEIGEKLLLVQWLDDTYRIVNSDVYEETIIGMHSRHSRSHKLQRL